MARIVSEIETESGSTVRKIETTDGQFRYQSFNNQRGQEGVFIPNEQGRALFTEAGDDPTVDQSQVDFTVEPQTEQNRKDALRARYTDWDNTEGYNPDVYPSDVDGKERQIISYMSRKEIEEQIEQDPFIESSAEKTKAREALAREVMDKIEDAGSEREVERILQQYFVS
jgi:hypothetical protein